MDSAFQLLSRGGVKFDKSKDETVRKLFTKSKSNAKSLPSSSSTDKLPPELDFFKYAHAGPSKRKSDTSPGSRSKKRKIETAVDDEESDGSASDSEDEEALAPIPKHRVKSTGLNVPQPLESFKDMQSRYSIPSHLSANLAANEFHTPTGIQAHGIPIMLEGRDLAAISPTGTGKTLSYLLPIFTSLHSPSSQSQSQDVGSGVRALVVAPTRELAHQIHNECLKLALGRKWRMVLFSKATANNLKDKAVRDKIDIIISTPLRLVASLQSGDLELSNVRHLILDEADRMLDTEFLEQIQEIVAACSHKNLRKAVFSATLPAGPEKIAMDMMRDPIRVVVGLKDTPLPLISQSLVYTANDSLKLPTLLSYLSPSSPTPFNAPLLIFTSTQPRAASLAAELTLHGIPNVDALHAGMSNHERDESVSRMRRGECWVMVCTEVASRGLDFKGVREVVNYDLPRGVQSYVHRIGRTGRAGRSGKAITYFTDEDAPYLKSLANVLLQSGSPVPEWILKLPKPSKIKRKQMGKAKRAESVNAARDIGRRDAVKRREMIEGSKRRKAKEGKQVEEEGGSGSDSD